MERRLIVSDCDGVRYLNVQGLSAEGAMICGAGAVCVHGGQIYCASRGENVVWRLNARTMMPEAILAGGPDMTHMAVSPDGERLYLLCAGADSVMMLDARSGSPLLLARVGQEPRQMTLASDRRELMIAGGGSGEVVVLSALTLERIAALRAPGPVYSAVQCGGEIYALCLGETLNACLASFSGGRMNGVLALEGLPGMLLPLGSGLIASTYGRLNLVSRGGRRVFRVLGVPGRASWLDAEGGACLMVDDMDASLYSVNLASGARRVLCCGVHGAAWADIR